MGISSVGTLSIQKGLATGLDTASLIDSMIEAESAPITILQRSQTSLNKQKTSLQTLQSKLETLQKLAADMDGMNSTLTGRSSTEEFFLYSTSSSDEDLLTLSAQEGAKSGSYNIEIKELAQETRVAHNGCKNTTDALSSEDAVFILKMGEEEKSIQIQGGVTTLSDLKSSIEDLDENLHASIINTGQGAVPYRLMISGGKTGSENSISIAAGTTLAGFSSSDFTETQTAKDAHIILDGIDVYRSENSFSDVLDGVTITLNGKTEAEEKIQAKVELNDTAIRGKIGSFISAFNDTLTYLQNQSYNKDTKTSGILAGDNLVLSMQSRLRNFISKPIDLGEGKNISLSEIGIKTTEGGTLKLDESIFSEALKTNFQGVHSAFTGSGQENGIAGTLNTFLSSFLKDGGGIIQGRTSAIEKSVKRMDDQISNMQTRMEKRRASLLTQFTNMEKAISSIQSTQTTLNQYFWSS